MDGGVLNRLPMTAQGSMQFQAKIPGEVNGMLNCCVAAGADAGNAFASSVMSDTQTSPGAPLILSVDAGTAGVSGKP